MPWFPPAIFPGEKSNSRQTYKNTSLFLLLYLFPSRFHIFPGIFPIVPDCVLADISLYGPHRVESLCRIYRYLYRNCLSISSIFLFNSSIFFLHSADNLTSCSFRQLTICPSHGFTSLQFFSISSTQGCELLCMDLRNGPETQEKRCNHQDGNMHYKVKTPVSYFHFVSLAGSGIQPDEH